MKISGNIPFKQARNYRKGRGRQVQVIVLHSMEAPEKGNTAENVASYFAGSNAPMASAHYCVDSDSIVQCVRLDDTAYHCKNANSNGIGIEHAGYAKQTTDDWTDDYGKAMLELSAELTASLCHQFNIPVRRARFAGKNNPQVIESGLCGHADVPLHGSHWDPGKGFPWDYYLQRVEFYYGGTADSPDTAPLIAEDVTAPTETSVTVTDGNVKVETSEGTKPQEKIAIEKPSPKSFASEIKKDIGWIFGGEVGVQTVREGAEKANFLGLSARFWVWISIIALVAGAAYLISKFYKHRSDTKRDLELTNLLVQANSTANNVVELVDTDKIKIYEGLKYKIIRR